MSTDLRETTLALAGIAQATIMVEQLAKTGYVPLDAYKCSIESLLDLNPKNTLAVFGGNVENLRLGLETLRDLLQGQHKHQDTMRYCLGALHLQKSLSRDKTMLNLLGNRLEQAAQQALHFSSTHDNVIANLGDIYSSTISTFRFRIQVMGEQSYLSQPRMAHQIRALLLAAIRSTTLWRQLGGNRWQLLLQRKRLAKQVDQFLRTTKY